MKRSIVDGILALPLRWVDESIPEERIQAFLSAHTDAVKANPAFSEMDAGIAADWHKSLPDGKPFTKDAFVPGLASVLEWMDAHGAKDQKAFATTWLEKLLRHVEVRRKACLPALTLPVSPDQLLLERYAIAALFCRVARRHHDLRYLNAAFKLNDWAFANAQSKSSPVLLSAFLHALEEQETTIRELLT